MPEVLEEELSLTRRDHLRASLSALEFAMQSPQEHGRGQGPSSRESTKEVKSLLVQALNSAGVCWLSGVKKPRVLSTREARIAEVSGVAQEPPFCGVLRRVCCGVDSGTV